MHPGPESERPPLPAEDAPPVSRATPGSWWRKGVWIVVATAVAAPPLWVMGIVLAIVAYEWLRFTTIPEGDFILFAPAPFVVAVVLGLIVRGLRRGWYRRTWIIAGLGATYFAVVVALSVWVSGITSQKSENMAVLCHLRQLAAAADQYFLENGTTYAAYADLVGPTKYVKSVDLVAGERYPAYFTQGVTITVTGVAGARTITYAP